MKAQLSGISIVPGSEILPPALGSQLSSQSILPAHYLHYGAGAVWLLLRNHGTKAGHVVQQ